jgi:DNA-binding transcriptional LysR family regulator
MELRDLEYFSVVAEHGNVGRAAEALDLSPPALSKSLRRLEKAVGAKLVKKIPKGIELTAVGAAMVDHARRIKLTLHDVTQEVVDLSQGQAGRLSIAAGPVIVEDLPRAYTVLRKDAPKLKLDLVVTDNDESIPLLRQGKLDLIVNTLPASPYEGTAQERLYDDDWVVCAAADHPLFRKKRVTINDLVGESWALTTVDPIRQYPLLHLFRENRLSLSQVAVQTRSLRFRLCIVATTRLLSFTSRRVLRQASEFRLKEIPIRELTWRRPVGVIYRKNAYLSPTARRFIDVLKSTAQDLGNARG